MKKLAQLFLILAILIVPTTLRAATTDELRQNIQERQDQIKKLEAEIAQYQGSLENQSKLSSTLKNEVTKLETQIKKLNADITLTRVQIQKQELQISVLDGEITTKAKTIDSDHQSLAELLRSQQETDQYSIVEMLLARESLSDFFNDQTAVLDVQKNIQMKVITLRQEKQSLQTQQRARQVEKEKLQTFQTDLAGKRKIQEGIVGSKSTLLKQSKNQESQYQKILAERARQQKLIEDELAVIEEELRKLIDPSLLPSKGSKVLGWPTENPIITQGFGYTEFSQTTAGAIYKGKGHNGIDLKGSIGTRILAAADGTVRDSGNTDAICPGGSYGKWISVEHAGNLTTIYGHLSQVVALKGQKVKRGDIIAYSGDSGYVTGPHLHFTVFASNTYRYSPTRHCGLVPTGGYLNPLDYL